MGTVFTGGISITYDDTGNPAVPAWPGVPPLLMVHGHPFDRSMWTPQLGAMHGSHRVIAPDLRGYGATTVVPGSTPLDTFARDLDRLLDHLGMPEAVLCGLSMGGQIVLEFHRLFPERVAGLVLADTFAQAETPEGRWARRQQADVLLREGMAGYAREAIGSMVAPATLTDLPDVAAQVTRMMRAAPPQGAAAALRGRAERPDYTPTLARIAVPTLVVVGSEDAFTPVSDARYLHERIRGSDLAVVQGAGHLPNLERPAEFGRLLSGLLTRVQAAARARAAGAAGVAGGAAAAG